MVDGPGDVNYGVAKSGLWGFTRGLALEGARHNIKVNAIAPWARTPMTHQADAARAKAGRSAAQGVDEFASLGTRLNLDPALVSPLVAYLAHDSIEVSGHIYSVGAGRVARYFLQVTEGYFDKQLSPESIRDNIEQIERTTGCSTLESLEGELRLMIDAVARNAS